MDVLSNFWPTGTHTPIRNILFGESQLAPINLAKYRGFCMNRSYGQYPYIEYWPYVASKEWSFSYLGKRILLGEMHLGQAFLPSDLVSPLRTKYNHAISAELLNFIHSQMLKCYPIIYSLHPPHGPKHNDVVDLTTLN